MFAALVSLASACSPTEEPAGFWEPGDQRITLESFVYEGGSFIWAASRQSLTREQGEALAKLKRVEGTEGCVEDGPEYTLVIEDAVGQEKKAFAREGNKSCGRQEERVDIKTLRPLLSLLPCIGTGGASPQLDRAKTVHADDGCRHGFFSYRDEPARWLKVEPSRVGRHTFRVSQCIGKATGLELFDTSATVLLAQSRAEGASDSDCATLTHPLEDGHVYALRVTSRAVSVGGHVYLEIRGEGGLTPP